MFQSKLQLILASESPRRRQLLQQAGFSFTVFSVKVSEYLEKNLTVDEQIQKIAERKAEAALLSYNISKSLPFLLLSADTMVVFDERPLGKPENENQAADFLGRLSGQWHEVKTALCLIECLNLKQVHKKSNAIETTRVKFRPLSENEIKNYIASGEPMDKAGAYGIQGLGGQFVEKIEGPYDNVVGLPVKAFKNLLAENSWTIG